VKDSRGLNNLVAIKDLLWHLCILWYMYLNVKGFCVGMHFFSKSVMSLMFIADHFVFLHKSSTYSPFIMTHCLEFIRTSLVHACLV
jgi:hypothetical protein